MSSASLPAVRLHHAPSSYYSMIARLALTETGVGFKLLPLDIHRRMEQFAPAYAALNPGLTVPTLVLADRVLADSRDILDWAFDAGGSSPATADAVARHYSFPVEDLTFSWLLSWNPMARRMVPKKLASAQARLLALASTNPGLADIYRSRAEVFAARFRTFEPAAVPALFERRWREAQAHLDWLDHVLSDGRQFIASDNYGPADVVWTVFLARIRFIRRGMAIEQRPSLRRYEAAMRARPSFEKADVWARIHWLRMLRQIV